MQQAIKLTYFNAALKTGLVSWIEAYVLFPAIEKPSLETYKDGIIYPLKGSTRKANCIATEKRIDENKSFTSESLNWLFDYLSNVPLKKQKALKANTVKALKMRLWSIQDVNLKPAL